MFEEQESSPLDSFNYYSELEQCENKIEYLKSLQDNIFDNRHLLSKEKFVELLQRTELLKKRWESLGNDIKKLEEYY